MEIKQMKRQLKDNTWKSSVFKLWWWGKQMVCGGYAKTDTAFSPPYFPFEIRSHYVTWLA